MILEAKNVSFSYVKGIQVLKKVNLAIEENTVTCLMGPNGSGKTTFLDCLMGMQFPESGEITLLGRSLRKYKRNELARYMAYIPQSHPVTFPYTVREIVMMGRMSYVSAFGAPGAADQKACDEAIRLAGLENFADRPYCSLSGGEIRLVLLARALCQEAKVILMDEPAAYLDFRNELLFLERVVSLVKDRGVTVVMVTHAPNHGFYLESNSLNVNAVLMSEGEIVMSGKPSEVITEASIAQVFGVEGRITETEGYKSITMVKSL